MLVLLLAKPNFLFDVGFQLSYAAVFAIVWLQPLYSRIRTSKYKAVNYFTDTVVISIVAQIGVLPLSLYYFNQFPLLFLFTNIIVIPLSTLILLIGIIVLVLNFTLPSVAVLVGKILELLIILMNRFIEWLAGFESLVIKDIPFSLLLNIALYSILTLVVFWLYKKSYKRTTVLLASVIVFQVLYTATALNAKEGSELIVFNNRKNTSVAIKDGTGITVYSTDSLAGENSIIRSYSKGMFNPRLVTLPLKNTLFYSKKKILVMDSLGVYPAGAKPDVLILTNSTKVNLERILHELKPKQIVADATNYKSYIKRWQTTCKRFEVPFHATTEKGFYRLSQ
jgi:competence protein ComEC